MRLNDTLSKTVTPQPATRGAGSGVAATGMAPSDFKQAFSQAQSLRAVAPGDTLVGIVRQHAVSRGMSLNDSQALRWAQNLASHNGVDNANRIRPGQQLNMASLDAQWQNNGATPPTTQAKTHPTQAKPLMPSTAAVLAAKAGSTADGPARANNAVAGAQSMTSRNPVLDKTLDRAVNKGFIPANEKQAVYQKVLQMASKHGFAPDDFARLTLMESDGMNPKASNQRCHGIIQFCDGPARGAATVGMAANPKSILGLSVYQQLHLADTYFEKAGLNKQQGSVPLDDLYLSVLQPTARSETRTDAPLGIMGTQAGALYSDRNNNPTITRQSLVRGLIQNAQRVLGLDRAEIKKPDHRAQSADSLSPQRMASYDTQDPLQTLLR